MWSSSHRDIFVESQLWNNTKVPTIREIRDTVEVPLVRFIDKDAVDVPVVCSDRWLLSQEIPHVYYIERISVLTSVLSRQVRTIWAVRKTVTVILIER